MSRYSSTQTSRRKYLLVETRAEETPPDRQPTNEFKNHIVEITMHDNKCINHIVTQQYPSASIVILT